MFEIGRIVIKTAGRDAGNTAVVVDTVDGKFVLIDGNVRRRKCNIAHLEPTTEVLKIKKAATTSEVHKAMKDAGIKIVEVKKVRRSVKTTKPVAKPKKNGK